MVEKGYLNALNKIKEEGKVPHNVYLMLKDLVHHVDALEKGLNEVEADLKVVKKKNINLKIQLQENRESLEQEKNSLAQLKSTVLSFQEDEEASKNNKPKEQDSE
ncbi:MAG: hypothetical protein AAF378_10660 [Cyanobacteria bacterium P01_A01_bin.84]